MKRLSKKQILMLHTQLIQQTGGSDGVRDYNLLDSALETPFQSFGGEELYPTLQAKAARLGYGLIKNHCMIDGNKRIGTHTMLVFLALNGIELSYTQKELYETILNVAAGNITYEGLLEWILEHQTLMTGHGYSVPGHFSQIVFMILFPANTDKYPSSSPRGPLPRVSSPLFLQSPDLHTVSYVLQSKSPQTPPSPRPRFLSGFGLRSQARIPLSGLPVRSG